MTISIWRYSHLLLALVSSLFLVVASITGTILAVEPITHQASRYDTRPLDQVLLATTIESLNNQYDEVFALEIEKSGFVKASVLTDEMETLNIYIDAKNGKQLGIVQKRAFIYEFATNLHRSLFLKTIGRIFVGVISLLLLLIAFTGFLLLIKRQGGVTKIFSKVQKDYFELRYHVILSRLLFFPIIIIATTGVFLSLEKFEILPQKKNVHKEINQNTTSRIREEIEKDSFFNTTTLDQVRSVAFPFSDDPEEYYEIALHDKEVFVNQQTGQVISEITYPFIKFASRLSWNLHTGEGNVLWSIVLFIASFSILFFMYTGFLMAIKRLKKSKITSILPHKDVCDIVLLVGSETGTSFDFAQRLHRALSATGKKVFMTEMNNYSAFAKAEHLIILTATYGEGEAPTNARKFAAIFPTVKQPKMRSFSVVGFGSIEYPKYCKFAVDIDTLLKSHENFKSLLPLYKINNADFADFSKWVAQLGEQLNLTIPLEKTVVKRKKLKKASFKVISKSPLNIDNTFILKLQPLQKSKFTSGDLLSVFTDNTSLPRQYSIARINDNIVLSIKKHELGKASTYLYDLEVGNTINAAIELNPHFHFPASAKSAILISNGTGIAPFIGMIKENYQAEIHLFWGGRTHESAHIYDEFFDSNTHLNIDKAQKKSNKHTSIHKCFSKESTSLYVQNLVAQHPEIILKTIQNDGVIMICGSLAMQHGVLDMLEQFLLDYSTTSLDELQHKGQLLMDCY